MDKHFGNNRIPRIAVNYWSGALTEDLQQILNHNAKYFDYLYVLVDDIREYPTWDMPDNLLFRKINVVDILQIISLPFTPEESLDARNLLYRMGPAALSDLICYFPKKIVNALFLEEYPRVMYFDLNTIVWNQYMVNELFGEMRQGLRSRLYLKESLGTYLMNDYDTYISSDWSLDTRDEEGQYKQFNKHLVDCIKKLMPLETVRYTALGPSFLNRLVFNATGIEILPIKPNEICPDLLYEGVMNFSHKAHSFGLALSNTLYESAGYKIINLAIAPNNSCLITFAKI